VNNLFQTVWTGYSTSLIAGTQGVTSSALGATAGILQAALGLYVIITGLMMMFAGLSWSEGKNRVVRALIVSAVLAPATFNTYVTDLFNNQIPQFIVSSLGVPGASLGQNQYIAQFDLLRMALFKQAEAIRAQAVPSFYYISERIDVTLVVGAGQFSILICFVIAFLAHALMALIICFGPIAILLWLFNETRGIGQRWLSKLIGYSVCLMLIMILLQVVQVQNTLAMARIETSITAPTGGTASLWQPNGWGGSVPTSGLGGASQNIDAEIETLWQIALVLGMGALLAVAIVPAAAYIGGGVGISVTPIFAMVRRSVMRR
jgi:hypothetical protein